MKIRDIATITVFYSLSGNRGWYAYAYDREGHELDCTGAELPKVDTEGLGEDQGEVVAQRYREAFPGVRVDVGETYEESYGAACFNCFPVAEEGDTAEAYDARRPMDRAGHTACRPMDWADLVAEREGRAKRMAADDTGRGWRVLYL